MGEAAALPSFPATDGDAEDDAGVVPLGLLFSAPSDGEQALKAMATAAPTAKPLSAFRAIVSGMRPSGFDIENGRKRTLARKSTRLNSYPQLRVSRDDETKPRLMAAGEDAVVSPKRHEGASKSRHGVDPAELEVRHRAGCTYIHS